MSAYSYIKHLVNSDNMTWGVLVASFMESTVVPVPLELLLIPVMQANRKKIWLLSLMALLGCVIGAIGGYYIGHAFYETAGTWLVNLTGSQEQFDSARQAIQNNGFWFIMSVGVTPVPFQIAMVAAGAASYSLAGFLTATAIARAVRYFGLGTLVFFFGDKAMAYYKRHKVKAAIISILVVGGFWVLFGFVL